MNHNHHEENHQHNHEHNHEHNSKISFLMIIRLAISSLMLISTFFIPYTYKIAVVVITVLAWLIAGYDILIEAVENVFHKDFLDENFLMIVASAGALAIGENTEAVLVIILFQIGEYLQGLAVSKSESGIKSLVNLRSDYANLMKDGELIAVKPEEIHTNDQIIVKPGEKIPLDGTVIKGDSFVDTSNLTGESVPRKVKPGDTVLSGCVNGNGELTLSVTSEYKDSTVSVILSLVEDASSGKSKSENFITSFSKIYTPCVVGLALLICVSLPLVYLKTGVPFKESFVYWLHKSLTFLVVSCPCALVISVPLSYFAGIG